MLETRKHQKVKHEKPVREEKIEGKKMMNSL